MRRGLMAWDASELPLETLAARLARTQSALAEAQADALLLYTNFIRCAAVSWFTGFSPYWADGLLMVPAVGEPVFATTLSNRVATWVDSVKPVGALLHSPRPAFALGERLERARAKTALILELDDFPGGLYDELAEAAPALTLLDGSDLFARIRAPGDETEISLLRRAEAMAEDALDQARLAKSSRVGDIVGAVERHARALGAEEVYVAIAPDLDQDWRMRRLSGDQPVGPRYALRASIAYKGAWTRRVISLSQDRSKADRDGLIDRWFAEATQGLDPRAELKPPIEALAPPPCGARIEAWLAESVLGTRPLEPIAGDPPICDRLFHPAWAVLELRLSVGDQTWLGARLIGVQGHDGAA